jgi:hypothetical protein
MAWQRLGRSSLSFLVIARLFKSRIRLVNRPSDGHRPPFIKTLCEMPAVECLEAFRELQHAQGDRLMRNSASETIAPRNRSLVIDRYADRLG